MFSEHDAVPVPTQLLNEARHWAPIVDFDFDEYAAEYFGYQPTYPGTADAAYLDWMGMHLWYQAGESSVPPEEWPAELRDVFDRLERRFSMWLRHIDRPKRRQE
jgi:hypothetical protein